eukprot:gene16098-18179_t
MKTKDSLTKIILFLGWMMMDWMISALEFERRGLMDIVQRRKILSDLNMDKFTKYCNGGILSSPELGSLTTCFSDKYCWFPRFNDKKQLVTYEIYEKNLPAWVRVSPLTPHVIKPIAKTNLRTYTASTTRMDEAIEKTFDQKEGRGGSERSYKIGLFVSMSVQQKFRKQGFGDLLLRWGQFKCKELGCDYMLLVHDDKGSGRLGCDSDLAPKFSSFTSPPTPLRSAWSFLEMRES